MDSGPRDRRLCNMIRCLKSRHVTYTLRHETGHSLTRKKQKNPACINYRGAVRICVTAPIYLPGPTNPWALHLPTPLPRGTPHGRLHGPAWTCVASCHVSAPCAPPAPRVGHPQPCHLALVPSHVRAVVPCATSTRHLDSLTTSSPASK